jgi:DNA-3-methyladenine glycosylase I
MTSKLKRCEWPRNELAIKYHDEEWGVPLHDDDKLFEFLILEGAQAGLSWDTILRKRENYRKAFDKFDVNKVARYTDKRIEKLLQDEGIIRNRLKVASAVSNAKVFLNVQKEFGSFDKYIWAFIGGKPIVNKWKSISQIPATSPESDTISKDMKKRGFNFVGSTIIYAHMQATGMVNDHLGELFSVFRRLSSNPKMTLNKPASHAILFYLILVAIACFPIWRVQYFVNQDGSAHVHSASIMLRSLVSADSGSEPVILNPVPVPNSSGHWLLALFLIAFSPFTATKLVLTLTYAGFVASVWWLRWASHRFDGLKTSLLFGSVLAFNWLWLIGMYNFTLSIIIMIAAYGLFVYWDAEMNWTRALSMSGIFCWHTSAI